MDPLPHHKTFIVVQIIESATIGLEQNAFYPLEQETAVIERRTTRRNANAIRVVAVVQPITVVVHPVGAVFRSRMMDRRIAIRAVADVRVAVIVIIRVVGVADPVLIAVLIWRGQAAI
jgi:hypothetical protein